MTSFTYSDCELDFGTHSLGGDWTLTIETDDGGLSFKLIDAETCLKGVSRACFALIQEWIDDDTAPRQIRAKHKSLVRQAYNDAVWLSDPVAARSASRADDIHDARMNERAA